MPESNDSWPQVGDLVAVRDTFGTNDDGRVGLVRSVRVVQTIPFLTVEWEDRSRREVSLSLVHPRTYCPARELTDPWRDRVRHEFGVHVTAEQIQHARLPLEALSAAMTRVSITRDLSVLLADTPEQDRQSALAKIERALGKHRPRIAAIDPATPGSRSETVITHGRVLDDGSLSLERIVRMEPPTEGPTADLCRVLAESSREFDVVVTPWSKDSEPRPEPPERGTYSGELVCEHGHVVPACPPCSRARGRVEALLETLGSIARTWASIAGRALVCDTCGFIAAPYWPGASRWRDDAKPGDACGTAHAGLEGCLGGYRALGTGDRLHVRFVDVSCYMQRPDAPDEPVPFVAVEALRERLKGPQDPPPEELRDADVRAVERAEARGWRRHWSGASWFYGDGSQTVSVERTHFGWVFWPVGLKPEAVPCACAADAFRIAEEANDG